jgi:hypothetical protein
VGASVEDVQHSLDHASLATTTTYLRKLEGVGDPFGPQLADLLLGADEGGTGCPWPRQTPHPWPRNSPLTATT